MKVYVLVSHTYLACKVIGVFATNALAQAFARDYDIAGWEIKEHNLIVR